MAEPALTDVMSDVLSALSSYFIAPGGSLPAPSASFLSVNRKNPAIGNRIHTDVRAGFPTAAIKAGHLDASVQLQIWDGDPADVETAMTDLQGRILADRDLLRSQGFLKLNSVSTSVSELVDSLSAWRKTSQFQVLYEYQYQDSDGAESLIHRIPISSDLEEENTPEQEITTVTNAIQRWDTDQALALVIGTNSRRERHITGINVLAYLPGGWLGASVILRRETLGNPLPPTSYMDLADFIDAVTDPVAPDTNAQIVFATVSDFVGALTAVGSTFPLGDWEPDGTPDQYQAYQIDFDRPIRLSNRNDVFRINYQSMSFDSSAVVYVRAKVN